jgi:hypothetical protein
MSAQSPIQTSKKKKKNSFFYAPTLPPRRDFVTHRCAHMRACSLHRCASVCTCLFHRRAPMHACLPYKRVEVHACSTHRRARVRACSTLRRALRAHLKTPLPRPHVHISSGKACTYVCLSLNFPRTWGPHPLNTSIRPSVQPLSKN